MGQDLRSFRQLAQSVEKVRNQHLASTLMVNAAANSGDADSIEKLKNCLLGEEEDNSNDVSNLLRRGGL